MILTSGTNKEMYYTIFVVACLAILGCLLYLYEGCNIRDTFFVNSSTPHISCRDNSKNGLVGAICSVGGKRYQLDIRAQRQNGTNTQLETSDSTNIIPPTNVPNPTPSSSSLSPVSAHILPTDGFQCKIPNVNSIATGADNRSTAEVCKKYSKANKDTDQTISFKEIAQSWKAAGNNMDYCPAALIIAGGECQQPSGEKSGCYIKGTGPSGIWQVDSARGSSLNLYSPCDNAKAVRDQIVRDPDSYDMGCYSGNNGEVTAPLRITGKPPGGGVGGADSLFYNTSNTSSKVGNCNWLGPFCHWQKNRNNGSATCCAWTGGGNSYQPQGFPYYYMDRFLTNIKSPAPKPKCPGHCSELAKTAINEAEKICKSVK